MIRTNQKSQALAQFGFLNFSGGRLGQRLEQDPRRTLVMGKPFPAKSNQLIGGKGEALL
jgi:hypothetical protein